MCLFGETFVTMIKRSGKEWMWFSPAIFCYLIAAVPPIWLLELQLIEIRLQNAKRVDASNITLSTAQSTAVNAFGLTIDIPLPLDHAGWALAMEQALLFIVILGRWFMPKGEISRNQLSQILLVYLGMAADIMELFEVFKEEKVALSQHLIYPILSLWSWALLQYTLVITATKAKKPRYGDLESDDDISISESSDCFSATCKNVNADILGIMSTILMQDGPFLCFRLYLLVGLQIVSQMMVFFICKNMLVLLLQIYRLIVIYMEKDKDEEMDETNSSDTVVGSNSDPETQVESGSNDGRSVAGSQILTNENETQQESVGNNKVSPSPNKYAQDRSCPGSGLRQSWSEPNDQSHNDVDHPNFVNINDPTS
ncbi:transmembrane protein 26-like isoform X2 [Clavelina lepadiformis]|uniref:transmembrane protein 26-like isoform X2 n=1 Tax=Clavelina lepadiformis TaxID=159417 RepID=UPI0040423107